MTRAAGGGEAVPFGPLDIAVAMAMNLLWGLNIVAAKITLGSLAPFTTGFVRLVAVGLICLPWARVPKGRLGVLLLFGFVNGGLFLLFMNLAVHIGHNVGALAIVGQLSVPIAIVLGALLLRERMTRMQMAGVVLAFAGVVLLLFDRRVFDDLPGLALMFGTAVCWGVSSLIQRKLAGIKPLTLYAWTGWVGAATLLPLALWFEPGALATVPSLSAAPLVALAFTVFGATLAGMGGMAWLLGRHPVSSIMPLTLAAPVVSVAAAHWIFGTPVTGSMIAGGLLALAGVVLVTMAKRRAAI